MDQKKIDKLMTKLEKANVAWKKASKNYQAACQKYHWTTADDGAKWKKVLALRNRDTAAFEKADAARKALVAAMRPTV